LKRSVLYCLHDNVVFEDAVFLLKSQTFKQNLTLLLQIFRCK
jgi:hypothetical protein